MSFRESATYHKKVGIRLFACGNFPEKDFVGVVLRTTGVRGPEKEIANDETVRAGIHERYGRVFLRVNAETELCCY